MSSESGVEFNSDAAEALKLAAAAATDSSVQQEEEQSEAVTTNGENGGGDHAEEESAADADPEESGDAGENGAGHDDPLMNEEEEQDDEKADEGGDDANDEEPTKDDDNEKDTNDEETKDTESGDKEKSKGPQILMMKWNNEEEGEGDEEKGEGGEEDEEKGEGEDEEGSKDEAETADAEESKETDEASEEKGEPVKTDSKEDEDSEEKGDEEGEGEEGESAAKEDKDKALDADGDAEAEGEGENDDPLGEHIEMDGEPVVDEDGANGIKEDGSDPEVSESELEPAMVDYPEKSKKKKRKRETSDSDFDEEFDEYMPSRAEKKKKKSKVKSVKNAKGPPRRKQPKDTLFQCKVEGCEAEFMSETVGDLNIHNHEAHDGDKPTYMDMAEAIVYKLNEKFGSSRTTILKNIMTEYGHWIEVNQNQAKAQLKRSLDKGLQIGRVRNGTLGKTGYLNIWLPNKDKRKSLVKKFNRKPKLIHVEDVPEEKEEWDETEVIMPRLLPKGGLSGPRSTRSGGRGRGRGRPPAGGRSAAKDDDEICVVEEKLTPLAKMKAKAYANAKAALAKKLPASFLKSGTTRMVRIGPGGVVRSEEGKIVTTLGRLTGSTLIPPHNKKKMAAVAEQEAKMRAAAAAAAAAAARKTVTGNPLFKDDDNDEDLTCTMCLSSFWYRNELIDHMKNTHNVEKPEKHLKAK